MKVFKSILASVLAAISSQSGHVEGANNHWAALDGALLKDLVDNYYGSQATTEQCHQNNQAATLDATNTSFVWPGTNPHIYWESDNNNNENRLFHAIMKHHDATGDRSWEIRIGSGGNIYSHWLKDSIGEVMAPQRHTGAPWIDEVQQTVSVNLKLNKQPHWNGRFCQTRSNDDNICKKYYIHQAGAYVRDGWWTNTAGPVYSPSLASHCEGVSCYFASWGTQAHIRSPFTSPVMYINKYTNCGNGAIEHDQMIHNFALWWYGTRDWVDQTWMNVGWGGTRMRQLPMMLEPVTRTGELHYRDPNHVGVVSNCPWADGANIKPLSQTGGFTTWVEPGLIVNTTNTVTQPWCKKSWESCYSKASSCMVPACSDTGVANGSYIRVPLRVKPREGPQCEYNGWNMGLVELVCNMRGTGFGHTTPSLQGNTNCQPWARIQFVNDRTGEALDVMHIKHWSFNPSNHQIHFTVNSWSPSDAINMVNNMFANWGSDSYLTISVNAITKDPIVPADYNPDALNTFSVVHGRGLSFGHGVAGNIERRIGRAHSNRDLTIMTILWNGSGARLAKQETFINRQFFLAAPLGDVQADANRLHQQTFADKIGLERWNPRHIDLYRYGDSFIAVPAGSAQGQSTTCNNTNATKVCTGFSTPKAQHDLWFYVTCPAEGHHYLGFNPYAMSKSWVSQDSPSYFPSHGSRWGADLDGQTGYVRPYTCTYSHGTRPTWKMIGWFTKSQGAGCTDLVNAVYDETLCN